MALGLLYKEGRRKMNDPTMPTQHGPIKLKGSHSQGLESRSELSKPLPHSDIAGPMKTKLKSK